MAFLPIYALQGLGTKSAARWLLTLLLEGNGMHGYLLSAADETIHSCGESKGWWIWWWSHCVVQAINGHSLCIITNLMGWVYKGCWLQKGKKKMNTGFQQVALLSFKKSPTLLLLNMGRDPSKFCQALSLDSPNSETGDFFFLKKWNQRKMNIDPHPVSNELFLEPTFSFCYLVDPSC